MLLPGEQTLYTNLFAMVSSAFRSTYTNPETGEGYTEGEIFKFPKMAQTLQMIADEGYSTFYTGALSKDILADLQSKGRYH